MSQYSINEIVELAVQTEHSGYAFYNEAAKHKGLDKKSSDLLIYLRDAELNHEKTFLALRDEEDLKNITMTQDWELVSAYLKTIVNSRLFSDADSAIRLASRANNFDEILDYAIRFEKDTLLFFHTIKDSITAPKAQAAVARIIQEELSHVINLSDYKAALR
ncbi:MAG TPA: ferritin family protein [Candidatus Cloacimonadota bacterium]|nr:ferritin family protein [Candidatus Cloacimonadota bacterium]